MANRIGYLAFIRGNMGIPILNLPDASTDIDTSLALAFETVNLQIQQASQLYYDNAVYNVAAHFLIENASDQTGLSYFKDLRKAWNVNQFVGGVIASTSDESTSESMTLPDFVQKMNLSELDYLKTPYGRAYMGIAQRLGFSWGMS